MLESHTRTFRTNQNAEPFEGLALALALCAVAVIGCVAPRALSFLPGLVGIIAVAAQWKLRGCKPDIKSVPFIIAAALIALGLTSAVWAIDPQEAIERSYKTALIIFPACLLIQAIMNAPRNFSSCFMKFAPYTLIIMLLWNAVELYSGGFFYNLARNTPELSNDFNFSVLNRGVVFTTLFFLPALAAFIANGHKITRPLDVKSLGLALAAVILLLAIFIKTDSQSAHMAFAIGIIFIAFYAQLRSWVWWPLCAIIIILMFASPWLAIMMFKTLPEYLGQFEWFQSAYAMHRMEIWDFIARYALQQPLYGYGIEATKAIQDFDTKMLYFRYPVVLHPHNFALQLWIEFGVIGITAGAIFLSFALYNIRVMAPAASRLNLGVFMAILLVGATSYGLWQGWFIGMIMFMIALCCVFVEHEKPTEPNI